MSGSYARVLESNVGTAIRTRFLSELAIRTSDPDETQLFEGPRTLKDDDYQLPLLFGAKDMKGS